MKITKEELKKLLEEAYERGSTDVANEWYNQECSGNKPIEGCETFVNKILNRYKD